MERSWKQSIWEKYMHTVTGKIYNTCLDSFDDSSRLRGLPPCSYGSHFLLLDSSSPDVHWGPFLPPEQNLFCTERPFQLFRAILAGRHATVAHIALASLRGPALIEILSARIRNRTERPAARKAASSRWRTVLQFCSWISALEVCRKRNWNKESVI